jgi:hypothetical protein
MPRSWRRGSGDARGSSAKKTGGGRIQGGELRLPESDRPLSSVFWRDKLIFIRPLIFTIMLFIFTKHLALSCFEC